MKKDTGFTLIELLTTITIFTLLLSFAIPSFRMMAGENQITSAYNSFLSTIHFARSEAIKRGNNIIICKWDHLSATCDSSNNWHEGWAVFDDKDSDNTKDSNEEIIRIHQSLPANIQMHYHLTKLKYNAEGLSPGYSGKIIFCSSESHMKKQGITISSLGRIRMAEQSEIADYLQAHSDKCS